MNPRRAEQGDRYFVKLFRDYVFHRSCGDGTPSVDLAHSIDSLIKVRLILIFHLMQTKFHS
jgi:PAB-dependent poly(A)-specific ribonuclease subunit 3